MPLELVDDAIIAGILLAGAVFLTVAYRPWSVHPIIPISIMALSLVALPFVVRATSQTALLVLYRACAKTTVTATSPPCSATVTFSLTKGWVDVHVNVHK